MNILKCRINTVNAVSAKYTNQRQIFRVWFLRSRKRERTSTTATSIRQCSYSVRWISINWFICIYVAFQVTNREIRYVILFERAILSGDAISHIAWHSISQPFYVAMSPTVIRRIIISDCGCYHTYLSWRRNKILVCNLRFSRQWLWRMSSSGI
jgi:hypothetical protein